MSTVKPTYGNTSKWRNSAGGNWSQTELEQLVSIFRFEPPLLDVGWGNGRWRKYYPTDHEALDFASGAAKPFIRGVAQHLPFKDESFRTVVAVTVIQHVPFPEKPLVYREILRVLQPNGWFLMVEGNSQVSNDYIWSVPVNVLVASVLELFHVVAICEPEGSYCALLLRKK